MACINNWTFPSVIEGKYPQISMIYGLTEVDGLPIAPHWAAYCAAVGCWMRIFEGILEKIV